MDLSREPRHEIGRDARRVIQEEDDGDSWRRSGRLGPRHRV